MAAAAALCGLLLLQHGAIERPARPGPSQRGAPSARQPAPKLPGRTGAEAEAEADGDWPDDDPAYQPAPLHTEELVFPATDGRPVRGYLAAHRAAMGESNKGIVILGDIYGWQSEETRAAAERIAASCEAHVLLPDLFAGSAWPRGEAPSGVAYERWRDRYPLPRIAADVMGAAAYLNSAHGVELLGLLGFCHGGGRALELLAGGFVDAHAAAVFYPTRYDAGTIGRTLATPLLAVFAGDDTIPGACPADARALQDALALNECARQRYFVRSFEGQPHGFAHDAPSEASLRDGDAAFKLAEAWFDKYLHPSLLGTLAPEG